MPAWCIKCSKLAIGTHLQFAINECLKENVFPEILKEAYVTPIYKKGDRLTAENYRPISVTPTLSKVFERLMLNQMTEYNEKKTILSTKISLDSKRKNQQ